MSTETSMDVGFWEKLGDGLSAFSEGLGKFLLGLFGSSNERYVRKLGYIRAREPGSHAHRHPRLAAGPGQRAGRRRCRPSATTSCKG